MSEIEKCNRNCACGRSLISFKFVSEKQIDIYNNGKKVGEIWCWKPSSHWVNDDTLPYSEKKNAYDERHGIQICGFSDVSEVWKCHIFKGTKDLVLTFKR